MDRCHSGLGHFAMGWGFGDRCVMLSWFGSFLGRCGTTVPVCHNLSHGWRERLFLEEKSGPELNFMIFWSSGADLYPVAWRGGQGGLSYHRSPRQSRFSGKFQ